jgi:hypothetical protein
MTRLVLRQAQDEALRVATPIMPSTCAPTPITRRKARKRDRAPAPMRRTCAPTSSALA